MKKIIICVLCLVMFQSFAYAEKIILNDNSTYEYAQFKPTGKGMIQSFVLELDKENNVLWDVEAIATYKGTTVDIAENNQGQYNLIYNQNGYMLAVKITGVGAEFIEFRKDGTYTFFASQTFDKAIYGNFNLEGNFTAIAFGTYKIEE
jgi:hypothetical protein